MTVERVLCGNLADEAAEVRGEIDEALARVLERGWFVHSARWNQEIGDEVITVANPLVSYYLDLP